MGSLDSGVEWESELEFLRVNLCDGFGELVLLLVGQVGDVADLVERHGDWEFDS